MAGVRCRPPAKGCVYRSAAINSPGSRQGHDLCAGLEARARRVLTCRRPPDTESAVSQARQLLLGAAPRAGKDLFKPLRQVIESVNQTLKAQLDLEEHGGRTEDGILARILYRILALTAAIWHNDSTGQDVKRSLTAYDH